jgi:hypothetical protein
VRLPGQKESADLANAPVFPWLGSEKQKGGVCGESHAVGLVFIQQTLELARSVMTAQCSQRERGGTTHPSAFVAEKLNQIRHSVLHTEMP